MQSHLTLLAATLLLTTFSTTAFATTPQPKPTDSTQQVVYHCDRETTVPVTYINTATGSSFAVIHVEGKQIAMKNATSASGARYISIDETQGYRWHTKGKTATLLHLAADHTAKETTILRNCTE